MLKFIWCAAILISSICSNLLADSFASSNGEIEQNFNNKKIKLRSHSERDLNIQNPPKQISKNSKIQEFYNLAGAKNLEAKNSNSTYLGSKFVSPDSTNTPKNMKIINPPSITPNSSPALANLQSLPRKATSKRTNKIYKDNKKPKSDGRKGYENTPYLMHTEVIYLY